MGYSTRILVVGLFVTVFGIAAAPAYAAFTAFESGHVRPMAMSVDNNRLFVVNTPDNRLEIFTITASGLEPDHAVAVGLEPVAVAVRNAGEVWVVNHLSDSISIIDVSVSPARVTRTLLVGDEPRDIVFAGTNGDRAFITTAHRGQNSPYTDPSDPGELTQPGIGRADVWVFDANALGNAMGGTPLTIVNLFGDTPRPLAVSPDGSTVYAGIFHSGNQTTTLNEGIVCNGGAAAGTCVVDGALAPGGLPAPNVDSNSLLQPEVGLIVKYDGAAWRDELGRDWSEFVRFNLPDKDLFAINANATPPVETNAYSGVGTILYNMVVNPQSGKLFVANTEAVNEVRFEGTREPGDSTSSVIGHQHETRITVINPSTNSVIPRHLNKHIDYSIYPAPAGTAENSLALPRQMAISSDGSTLYMAAKGSDKVGIFDVSQLESDSFVPSNTKHVHVAGGGPSGLVLDEGRGRLYVTTRFDNGISIINVTSESETDHIQMPNPEPQTILTGRRFLYDANLTSSNGEAACASCHVDGDLDSLAWDLGDPSGSLVSNPLDMVFTQDFPPTFYKDFHPMKGPMTTQTLKGMNGHGAMHWRGDRFDDVDVYDEVGGFKKFGAAFEGLLGRSTPGSDAEMQAFAEFILQVMLPPNPIRHIDNSLTVKQAAGQAFYFGPISDAIQTCNGCHTLDPDAGSFGTDGRANFEFESQHMKIPQLRNLYAKVGMFGMPDVPFFNPGDNGHKGDQIRGFGFLHDGSTDTLLRFLNTGGDLPQGFDFPLGDPQRKEVEQFLFAYDSNLKPVVGQQITLTDSNIPVVDARIDLLIARALAGDSDLVVKGVIGGQQRGWVSLGNGSFQGDVAAEPALTAAQLRALIQDPTDYLTYTAVPPGNGNRIGIDRDEDTVLDGDDNCEAVANLDQANNDGDGPGDACDLDDDNDGLDDDLEGVLGTNSLSADSDSDGVSDFDEVNRDGDPSNYTPGVDTDPGADDTDRDGLPDGVDPIPLTFNFNDGDVGPAGSPDTQVNGGDLLVLIQLAMGLRPVTEIDLAHGDLFPAGAPDGVITVSDVLQLQILLLQ